MNQQMTASPRRMKWTIASISWLACLVFLALLAFAVPSPVSAQENGATEQGMITLMPTDVLTETTLMPDGAPTETSPLCPALTIAANNQGIPKCSVLLRFRSSAFPPGAQLTAARLSLVAQIPPGDSQTIDVHWLPYTATLSIATDNLFGARTVPDNFEPGQHEVWTAQEGFAQTIDVADGFSLLLTTDKHSEGGQWFSDLADDSSNRPRLILEYTMPGQPAVTQAAGLLAVQSPRAFGWTGLHAYVTLRFPKAWSYTPAFYDNLVYLITEDANAVPNAQYMLQALDPLANPIWQLPLDSPGQHLLVSKSGRLYILGNDQIIVYQLNGSDRPTRLDVSPAITDINPSIAPSLGPDGSLYFVNNQAVYGLNPDLQELWRAPLTDMTASRVTVGPSGQFVYLTARNEGLVAIDAQTGESFANELPNQTALQGDDTPILHAPVVIRRPDGTEEIYVAANATNGGVLALFDNRRTALDKDEEADGDSATIVAGAVLTAPVGGWGQPIPAQMPPGAKEQPNLDRTIYAVRADSGQGALMAIDWLQVSASPMLTFSVAVSATAAPYLLNGGNLALDQAGNVFFFNEAGDTPGLYAFPAFTATLASPASGIPINSQLYFGSDGTLYANGVGAEPVLSAIVPYFTLGPDSAAEIASPTNLLVDGAVVTNTTLAAGRNVLLASPFSVTLGSTLSVSTGVPLVSSRDPLTYVPSLPGDCFTSIDGKLTSCNLQERTNTIKRREK